MIGSHKENAQKEIKKQYTWDPNPIGSGGFGSVFKGESFLYPDVKVAIKQMFKSSIQASLMDSIKAENKVLMKLDHPNIVKYFDMFEDEHYIFIVMNYIDGVTLSELLGKRKLDESEASKIMFQLASALAHCHSLKIAHRDIKPDNVLIDDDGNATLIDFGLAK